MANVLEKPQINPNSQRILDKSPNGHMPIYSTERYHKELENKRLKREAALEKKQLEELQKQMEEEEEIRKHFIHKSDKKLDLHEFYSKYNNQM